MSSDYYYTDSEETETKKKSSAGNTSVSAGKIEKSIKGILIAAGIILAAQLIWLFGICPFIPFSNVEVHGFSSIQRAEVLALAGLDETSSFFSTNAREVQDRVSSHVLVESAIVMKRFPDRLSIFLNPRAACAVTLINTDSGQAALFVDRHGVFFKTGEAGSPEILNLPVISGIENPHLGMRLPSPLAALAENIGTMAQASPELLSAISEIKIERKTWGGYELVLYPVHSSVRVRIENNLTEDTLRYMLLMLNVFEKDANKPQEIDFRSGIGSYHQHSLQEKSGEKSL